MENSKNKYYIRVNKDGKVIDAFSSAFEKAKNTDILIGEGYGSQFRVDKEVLCEDLQGIAGVENGLEFVNEQGLHILKYVDGKIVKVSDKELQAEVEKLPKPKPSKVEALEKENAKLKMVCEDLELRVAELESRVLV